MLAFLKKLIRNKKWGIIAIASLIFTSLILLFPAGALNSSTQLEKTANYLTDVVSNHTVSKQYLGLLVEPKDDSDKKTNDSVSEFRYLYGNFKETKATYISSINADKTHSVYFKNIDDNTNYSFLNNDHGFGTPEYKGHYKTEVYPLELMFLGRHLVPSELQTLPEGALYTNFIYISQTNADKLLIRDGLEPNEENYKSLLGKYVHLEIDTVDYFFWIEDIYLETNYFYEAVNEVIGDFFMCGGYPKNFKKQALFFLRDYSFPNKYYIEYSTTTYSTKYYDYKILEHNLVDDYSIDQNKFIIETKTIRNVASILLIVLSVSLALASLTLVLLAKYALNVVNHIEIGGALFVPYIIFWIISLLFKNTLILSNFTTSWVIGVILGFVILYILILCYKKMSRLNAVHEVMFDE